MIRKIRIEDMEKHILFYLGFFGTMPILQINNITFFTYIFAVLILIISYKLYIKEKILINKKIIFPYFILIIVSTVSVLVCYKSDIPYFWKESQIVKILWLFAYFYIYIYYSDFNGVDFVKCYLKGIYYASIVQVLWGVIQFTFDHVFAININDLLFIDTLHMVSQASQVKAGDITLSGLCWNAGNMAPLIVFGYAFSNQAYMKLIFIFFSLLCGSRTAALGCILCASLEFIYWLLINHARVVKNFIIIFSVISIIILSDLLFQYGIYTIFYEKFKILVDAFMTMDTQSSANLHIRYWTSIPYITANTPIMTNLFGFGLGCSGYSQVKFFNQYITSDYSWVLECDYINILWNTGYIGFFVTYIWMGINVIKGFRIDYKYFLFFASILVEGITYNVMFDWCWIAILFLFILIYFNQTPNFVSNKT